MPTSAIVVLVVIFLAALVQFIIWTPIFPCKYLYAYFFEREDFNHYRDVLKYIKKGGNVPMYPGPYFFDNQVYKEYEEGRASGFYFLVMSPGGACLYYNGKLLLTDFWRPLIDHLVLKCHTTYTYDLYTKMSQDEIDSGGLREFIYKYIRKPGSQHVQLSLDEFIGRYNYNKTKV